MLKELELRVHRTALAVRSASDTKFVFGITCGLTTRGNEPSALNTLRPRLRRQAVFDRRNQPNSGEHFSEGLLEDALAVLFDVFRKAQRVVARELLREFRVAPFKGLYDLEMIFDRSCCTVIAPNRYLPDAAHVQQ